MPATPLPATSRYIQPEVTVVVFMDTVADIDAITRTEIDAGTDFSGEIAGGSGWEISADRVAVPDLGNRFTGRISGRVNPGDAQLVLYADETTADVRDVLARGDQGYVYIAWGGDVPTQKASVFEVDVSAVSQPLDVAGTEGARINVDFGINRVAENIEIPALV